MTTNGATEKLKKAKLRYNEYYDIQYEFDKLYQSSLEGKIFSNLLDLIVDNRNIALAYRTLKTNTGSKTAGVNGHTIEDIANLTTEQYTEYIKARLRDYEPHKVRRVEIPKSDGKTRPLGIPTIEDRLVQQCIKQVLEPICEAKFHNKSYGFRPNRSVENAIAMVMKLVNIQGLHYIVDIDIKGFFDNVNQGKLLKQMWTMGIRDKNLLCIMSKMLKAEVENVGIPEKGTPQGGVLSPLLSNIVLNELDWWISNQWETFQTEHKYEEWQKNGEEKLSNKFRALKTTKMKEMFIVRYADDFKILCRKKEDAKKIFFAVKEWLKERLNLDINEDKSSVTDITKKSTEFLGFELKAMDKNKKKVIQSHMTEKAIAKFIEDVRSQIDKIQKYPSVQNVNKYNSLILGKQEYYKIATMISIDMAEIAYLISRRLKNRIRQIESKTGFINKLYKERYKGNHKKHFIANIALFPIADIKHKNPKCFSRKKNDYTTEGRKAIHDNLHGYDPRIIRYIMNNPIENMSTEYNDNRISLYVGQLGKCGVTKENLQIGNMEVHHKLPKRLGGTDNFKNLIFLKYEVHKLIHAVEEDIINKYLTKINPNKECLDKINKLRTQVGNLRIKWNTIQ